MVNRCVNPDCRTEFKVLSSGDLYAYERRWADTEFFWLCSACSPRYDLYLDPAGRVSMRPRSAIDHRPPADPDRNLRLITRSTRSMPRLQTVPSSERAPSYEEGVVRFWSDLYILDPLHR